MAKVKTSYICNACGYQTNKWNGCCPSCQAWASLEEEVPGVTPTAKGQLVLKQLRDIPTDTQKRLETNIPEWDRVVGGGIVPGAFLLVTGDPGIGKSTLLAHIAHHVAQTGARVFYFCSEESLSQVKLRAERIGCTSPNISFSDSANLEAILETCKATHPNLVIIDSIQNCYLGTAQSIPGTVNQLREAGFKIMQCAKEYNIAIIITGHITKDGTVAGPKMLEHMVDGVFYLQGEDRWQIRILRSVKNRFGTVDEIGFFQMDEHGLSQVPNINQQLLNEMTFSPGSSLISFIEGSRPMLVELQALTIPSKFGMPQRIVSGIDHKQVQLIAAILEKYLRINLSTHDIFFKVSGCLKVKDSGADLGIALALLSSYYQKPLPEKSLSLGEISLTGQIKPVNFIKTHLNEAAKFGINRLLLSKHQACERDDLSPQTFSHVYQLAQLFED